jgi:hypothetical protein
LSSLCCLFLSTVKKFSFGFFSLLVLLTPFLKQIVHS